MNAVEKELLDLKDRVARLEASLERFMPPPQPPTPEKPVDEAQLLAWLKAQGFVRDPTPEERRLAAEWEALSEAEKQAHLDYMQSLVLDPPLSQIIIENRR